MRVIFTPLAERQIGQLHAYIAEHASEGRADAYLARIVTFCSGLATFPLRGQKRDDILPGLRTIGFERRITIAFVVAADTVLIEGVFTADRTSRRPSKTRNEWMASAGQPSFAC